MKDLVVVVPGITGSALAVRGSPVWGLSGRAIMRGVLRLGRHLHELRLPEGFGADFPATAGAGEPGDGVTATGLMTDLHVIPGLWSPIKGYDSLSRMFGDALGAELTTQEAAGNLLAFPYDWRLSNAVSGRRLAAAAFPALEAWRARPGNEEAKLVLVCHSMGGLVARWFLEVLGGWELTRWLITVGTPFRGSMDAVATLSEGLAKGLGPLRVDLSETVRSFPSLHELLPTYTCIREGDGYATVADARGLGLDSGMVAAAAEFHARLADAVAARPERGYDTVAIKGVRQPTDQTARVGPAGLELLRERDGVDSGGDGTVPRPSAHPPEWGGENGGATIGAAQRHAVLQDATDVHTQIYTKLTSNELGAWMSGQELGIELPHLLTAGEPLRVTAQSSDEGAALVATVRPHDGGEPVAGPELLTNLGQGRYEAVFAGLPPGTYETVVGGAPGAAAADPVADVTVVWDGRVDP